MIAVVGLNHRSAPIDIREQLSFDGAHTMRALKQLTGSFPDAEFVLLSTCNRVELYCWCPPSAGLNDRGLLKFFADYHQVDVSDFERLVYIHRGEDAVRHLLTVTSSLDSMVVGEGQIISQVKESYRRACTAKSSGAILSRLFHSAFRVAKKVQTRTNIATGRVSIAGVAVELATQLFAEISQADIVVIGAGEMGELLVKHLLHSACKKITVVNRSFDRGKEMAERYGIEAREWSELDGLLGRADIAIASAAVEDYLFTKKDVRRVVGKRRKGPLLVIDIAVPRNFEPTVNDLDDVYLYSIDELSQVAEENRKARESDVAEAMVIINEDVGEFMDWLGSKDIGPLIGDMRKMFKGICESELERFFVGDRRAAPCRNVLEPIVKRLVNRLLHGVIKSSNSMAKEHGTVHAAKFISGIVEQAQEPSVEESSVGESLEEDGEL